MISKQTHDPFSLQKKKKNAIQYFKSVKTKHIEKYNFENWEPLRTISSKLIL